MSGLYLPNKFVCNKLDSLVPVSFQQTFYEQCLVVSMVGVNSMGRGWDGYRYFDSPVNLPGGQVACSSFCSPSGRLDARHGGRGDARDARGAGDPDQSRAEYCTSLRQTHQPLRHWYNFLLLFGTQADIHTARVMAEHLHGGSDSMRPGGSNSQYGPGQIQPPTRCQSLGLNLLLPPRPETPNPLHPDLLTWMAGWTLVSSALAHRNDFKHKL